MTDSTHHVLSARTPHIHAESIVESARDTRSLFSISTPPASASAIDTANPNTATAPHLVLESAVVRHPLRTLYPPCIPLARCSGPQEASLALDTSLSKSLPQSSLSRPAIPCTPAAHCECLKDVRTSSHAVERPEEVAEAVAVAAAAVAAVSICGVSAPYEHPSDLRCAQKAHRTPSASPRRSVLSSAQSSQHRQSSASHAAAPEREPGAPPPSPHRSDECTSVAAPAPVTTNAFDLTQSSCSIFLYT